MATFLIILSCLLWVGALVALPRYTMLSPGLSYLGLAAISFAKTQGLPLLPFNNTILVSWLCIAVVTMLEVAVQPEPVRRSPRGMIYMTAGAVVGMCVGLLGFTFTPDLPLRYGIMVVATVAGVFFGYLFYTRTPKGAGMALPGPNFFRYLLAKGFPVAITVMQIGVALTLALALYETY